MKAQPPIKDWGINATLFLPDKSYAQAFISIFKNSDKYASQFGTPDGGHPYPLPTQAVAQGACKVEFSYSAESDQEIVQTLTTILESEEFATARETAEKKLEEQRARQEQERKAEKASPSLETLYGPLVEGGTVGPLKWSLRTKGIVITSPNLHIIQTARSEFSPAYITSQEGQEHQLCCLLPKQPHTWTRVLIEDKLQTVHNQFRQQQARAEAQEKMRSELRENAATLIREGIFGPFTWIQRTTGISISSTNTLALDALKAQFPQYREPTSRERELGVRLIPASAEEWTEEAILEKLTLAFAAAKDLYTTRKQQPTISDAPQPPNVPQDRRISWNAANLTTAGIFECYTIQNNGDGTRKVEFLSLPQHLQALLAAARSFNWGPCRQSNFDRAETHGAEVQFNIEKTISDEEIIFALEAFTIDILNAARHTSSQSNL